MTTWPAWSRTWSSEARSTSRLATLAPVAETVASVPMSAISAALAGTVSEKRPWASVTTGCSAASQTPLPSASTQTLAPT